MMVSEDSMIIDNYNTEREITTPQGLRLSQVNQTLLSLNEQLQRLEDLIVME